MILCVGYNPLLFRLLSNKSERGYTNSFRYMFRQVADWEGVLEPKGYYSGDPLRQVALMLFVEHFVKSLTGFALGVQQSWEVEQVLWVPSG